MEINIPNKCNQEAKRNSYTQVWQSRNQAKTNQKRRESHHILIKGTTIHPEDNVVIKITEGHLCNNGWQYWTNINRQSTRTLPPKAAEKPQSNVMLYYRSHGFNRQLSTELVDILSNNCTFFSAAQGIFFKTDPILSHNARLKHNRGWTHMVLLIRS